MDTTHLESHKLSLSLALVRLSNERVRLQQAKTEAERKARSVWLAGIQKEIADLETIIGEMEPAKDAAKTDAELLADLGL